MYIMYHPKVAHPHMSNNVPPMRSTGDQPLFLFGGSQTSINLGLSPSQYQGSHESFPQSKQVDAERLQSLQKKKRSPVKVLPK